ncbi:hypothetical protein QCA50_011129 [Cerrena zonata]|uniref:Peptidase metallopeptidase domain-containing protein n=1 Tax=Cerrena zonata TaxID=2478898 RepID=A0AAW0FXK2_9APHY
MAQINILETGRVTDFSLTIPATVYSGKSVCTEDEILTASGSLRVDNDVPLSFRYSCVPIGLPTSTIVDEAQAGGPPNAAVTQSEFLWDNKSVITYSYMGGRSSQHYKVDFIAQEWTWYTNIRFRKIKSDGMIRISFDPSSGSWSYVGRQCEKVDGNDATMNLGSINPTTMAPSLNEKGVILHEFGHALGLLHEHQSPSRSGVLTLNEMATKQYYKALHRWPSSRVEEQVLRVYDEHDVGSYSEMDFSSIMMYSVSYTINTEGVDITEQFNLSDVDKAYIFLNYPRMIAHVNTPEWSIHKALKVAGVTGRRLTDILNASSPDSIRKFFIQWNVENRVKSLGAI